MTNDELNEARAFLNRKEFPTPDDLIKLFFSSKEEARNLMSDELDPYAVDFNNLGDADEVRTESGTEWVATQLIWNTPEGDICRINLLKVPSSNPLPISFVPTPLDTHDILDINYEEVMPKKSWNQLMDEAVENENFEEAARLRDWDKELKKLLKSMKPDIVRAIQNHDLGMLNDLLHTIKTYRETLHENQL